MKKLLLCFSVIVAIALIWGGESRRFYCIGNSKCVTVWKGFGNVCCIIPGRYYGIIIPADDYIETTNSNLLTLYFTDKMPKVIIFQSMGLMKIKNADTTKVIFKDFNTDTAMFESLLYPPDSKKRSDMSGGAQLVDIVVHEFYAVDKDGKHL